MGKKHNRQAFSTQKEYGGQYIYEDWLNLMNQFAMDAVTNQHKLSDLK